MMDVTPNKALTQELIADVITPTESIAPTVSSLPSQVISEAYSVGFTQDQLPIIWPQPHSYQMSEEERRTFHIALHESVRIVGVGSTP